MGSLLRLFHNGREVTVAGKPILVPSKTQKGKTYFPILSPTEVRQSKKGLVARGNLMLDSIEFPTNHFSIGVSPKDALPLDLKVSDKGMKASTTFQFQVAGEDAELRQWVANLCFTKNKAGNVVMGGGCNRRGAVVVPRETSITDGNLWG